jgi:hypothetical protein
VANAWTPLWYEHRYIQSASSKGYFALSPYTKTIDSCAAAGGSGDVEITSAAHGLREGINVKLNGSATYSAAYPTANVTTNTFELSGIPYTTADCGTTLSCTDNAGAGSGCRAEVIYTSPDGLDTHDFWVRTTMNPWTSASDGWNTTLVLGISDDGAILVDTDELDSNHTHTPNLGEGPRANVGCGSGYKDLLLWTGKAASGGALTLSTAYQDVNATWTERFDQTTAIGADDDITISNPDVCFADAVDDADLTAFICASQDGVAAHVVDYSFAIDGTAVASGSSSSLTLGTSAAVGCASLADTFDIAATECVAVQAKSATSTDDITLSSMQLRVKDTGIIPDTIGAEDADGMAAGITARSRGQGSLITQPFLITDLVDGSALGPMLRSGLCRNSATGTAPTYDPGYWSIEIWQDDQ